MRRDTKQLAANFFDVLVVGGGIYGASTAYEAVQRGLNVALIEKSDFGGATSANSLKIIHGGLRYLQQADFIRMRESIRERRALLRIAPHLVHPLPVAIPTYGHAMRSKEIMTLAMLMNDLVSADRNWDMDPSKHIPAGRTISRDEALRLLPGIRETGLTGAAIYSDAQVYNSERLTLAFVQSAAQHGACAANYVEATSYLLSDGRVSGVTARDTLTGDQFDIRARVTVNMAGPWAERLNAKQAHTASRPVPTKAKAINIITRPLFETYAVGMNGGSSHDGDAVISKGNRLFFIAPWRGFSMVGTAYYPCDDDPDSFHVTSEELNRFLADINQACPGANLSPADVRFIHQGLLPMAGLHPETGDVKLAKHYTIEDERNGGAPGLISVMGVKYTTARDVAQKTVDRVFASRDQQAPPSATTEIPLYGGDIGQFDEYMRQQVKVREKAREYDLSKKTIRNLVMNYGTAYRDVIALCDAPQRRREQDRLIVLRAQIRYAIQQEMAHKLSDVIFRRTELGSAGCPDADLMRFSADCMANELGWDRARTEQELQEMQCTFRRFEPAPEPALKPAQTEEPVTIPPRVTGVEESKPAEQHWPVRLFSKSVLKQRKFREVTGLLGPVNDLHCLDIGGDNGVISFLLRQRGGRWASADLDERSVQAIRQLVGNEVYQLNGAQTPFADEEFDRVAVVDYLEHIRDDAAFVRELHRIIRPGGTVTFNVPIGRNDLMRYIRLKLGQTDEKHGHVRPGYTIQSLMQLLEGHFTLETYHTYSKFFSELIDALMVYAVTRLKKAAGAAGAGDGTEEQSSKGLFVTGKDLSAYARMFKLYSLIYPGVWLISKLDNLLFFTSGYMLIVRARVFKKAEIAAVASSG